MTDEIGVEWRQYQHDQWNAPEMAETAHGKTCSEDEWVLLAVVRLPDGRTMVLDTLFPNSTGWEEAIEDVRPVLDEAITQLGYGPNLGTRVIYDGPVNGDG